MKRLVILNPASRSGKAARAFAAERAEWARLLGPFELFETIEPGDATRKAREVLGTDGIDQLIAAGGDGTIHEVAAGFWEDGQLIRSDVPLGVINLGTGGDFHKTIVEHSTDYRAALAANDFSLVDAGRVQSGGETAHHFLNIASAGMAGEMLRQLKASRFQAGAAAYLYHSVTRLMRYDPKAVTVTIVDETGETIERTVELINVFVCNGRYSGGGMKWAPSAELNDGLLRVTLVAGRKKLPLVLQSQKVYAGNIESYPGTETFAARSLTIRSEAGLSIEADGEILDGEGQHLEFDLEPAIFPLVS